MTLTLRIILAIAMLVSLSPTYSQPVISSNYFEKRDEKKPYKVLTSGKQVTIKSTSQIKTVMVWTSSGHRIVEQKSVNANTFTFRISINERIFFIMLRMENGKHFTEKIGV